MEVFRVSAPAKVLLFGEHAVVYGHTCIAAALSDLRLITELVCTSHGSEGFTLEFEEPVSKTSPTPLRRTLSFEQLREACKGFESDEFYLPAPNQDFLRQMDGLVADESLEDANALRPCLFLICALLRHSSIFQGHQKRHNGLHLTIKSSNFPIGAGLGSSAALGVSITGALIEYLRQYEKTDLQNDYVTVNKYAFACEAILHGTPSGVDNTVSCYGGALSFTKLPTPSFHSFASNLNDFRFLIVNTNVPKSTKQQVANVRALYDSQKEETEAKFKDIDHIGQQFIEYSASSSLTESKLQHLIETNHSILSALGVSHPRIEEVLSICRKYGVSTKLTGAGGGGCTVSLLPSSITSDQLDAMQKELREHGNDCFLTSVGGSGYMIHSNE